MSAPLDAFFFDDAKEFALRFDGQLVHGVEIHGAGACQLEAARSRGHGVGECPALMAEQLRVDERRGQAGTVDRDKRLLRAFSAQVQLAGDHVLAGAGFAGDEDIGIGAREPPDLFGERPHHFAPRDETLGGH